MLSEVRLFIICLSNDECSQLWIRITAACDVHDMLDPQPPNGRPIVRTSIEPENVLGNSCRFAPFLHLQHRHYSMFLGTLCFQGPVLIIIFVFFFP